MRPLLERITQANRSHVRSTYRNNHIGPWKTHIREIGSCLTRCIGIDGGTSGRAHGDVINKQFPSTSARDEPRVWVGNISSREYDALYVFVSEQLPTHIPVHLATAATAFTRRARVFSSATTNHTRTALKCTPSSTFIT